MPFPAQTLAPGAARRPMYRPENVWYTAVMKQGRLRIFASFGEFLFLFFTTFGRMTTLRKIPRGETISPRFRTMLMLAVSQVNQCAYCSYLHARRGLEEGIAQEEIAAIVENVGRRVDRSESAGVLFAQHMAETRGNPSAVSCKTLERCYGAFKALQIRAFTQSVLFGNLCCNTVVSFQEGLLTPEEKKGRRLAYAFSLPIANIILKKSGMKEIHPHAGRGTGGNEEKNAKKP
ncbi:MAG: carboxymuconolactone decarboxylase family protein [Spirochaetales bacterium]|nr:carboxymuconolactone decarboxylase family protein [Spirochaetales bacterium]